MLLVVVAEGIVVMLVTTLGLQMMVASLVQLRMLTVANALHLCLEPGVLVRLVLHDPLGAVRFLQRVLTLDDVPVADLPVALVVTGFVVLHAVLELVLGVRVVILVVLIATLEAASLAEQSEATRGGQTFATTIVLGPNGGTGQRYGCYEDNLE